MTGLRRAGRTLAAVAAGIVVVGGAASLRPAAQTRDPEAAAQTQALRDLVSEVRALRAVIENYTQGQARVQTTTELLSIQQRRAADATARLDVTRRELDASVLEGRALSARLSGFEDSVRQAQGSPLTNPARQAMDEGLQQLKQEVERQAQQEQLLRTRESEQVGAAGLEEAKWSELVEQVTRSIR